MRYIPAIIVFIFFGLNLSGQTPDEPVEGSVSYISSQNVYVKFRSTENITVGDTLFISKDGSLIPVLKVENLSSISCVCSPISNQTFIVSDKIIAKSKLKGTQQSSETNVLPATDAPTAQASATLDPAPSTVFLDPQTQDWSG